MKNYQDLTASEKILVALNESDIPLAIHEMQIAGHSETALSARTRELVRDGFISGKRREGKAFKEWEITDAGRMVVPAYRVAETV